MSKSYEIIRLKLINFAHFSSILGFPEFEINRYNSKNDIILLVGGNGYGKSLLMSHWTPKVNESTNNRKRIIGEKGKEASKEVDIISYNSNNSVDFLYKCKIIYGESSTNCSIVRENPYTGERIELNTNGLVSSYEDILSQEFNLDKRYVNITYLSPQITSLVSMSPSIRYNYLSNWLPDISSYIDAYKIVFKKINSVNRQVKMLETDIGDISIENVTHQITNLKSKVKTIKESIDSVKNKKMHLTIVRDRLADVDRSFIKLNIDKLLRNKKILDSHYENLKILDKKSKLYSGKDGITKLQDDIYQFENNLKTIRDRLEWLSRSIDENRIRLKETEYNLGMLKDTGDSLPEIGSMIERIETSIIEHSDIIKRYISSYPFLEELSSNFTNNEFNILDNTLSTVRDRCLKIQELISVEKVDQLSKYSEINDKHTTFLITKIRELDNMASLTLEKISMLKNSPLDPSILDLIPNFCDFSRCGVIQEIQRLLSPDIEVEKLQIQLQTIYEEKSKVEGELELIDNENNDIIMAITYIGDIEHSLQRDKNYIIKLPCKIKDILSGGISPLMSNLNILLRDMEIIREFVSIRDQYSVYNTELKVLKDKETSLKFIRNMNSGVKNMNDTIDSLIRERNSLTDNGSILLKELQSLYELKESLTSIRENIDEYNIVSNKQCEEFNLMKKLCKDWYYREKLNISINNLDLEIRMLSNEETSTQFQLDSLNKTIITKKSLLELRDKLILSIKELELLQDAWNPKTGIPSLFIQNFLKSIHIYSNIYLEALNGKTLKISKFEIGKTAREFPIEVVKEDGSVVPDISQCSEGEISILTLAISLALLNLITSNGGYNILRIDELDSHLDFIRRKRFVEMIQERLKELNSKQCLIISHNNNFDEIPADIILFPGSSKDDDALRNKNILLDMRHIQLDKFTS